MTARSHTPVQKHLRVRRALFLAAAFALAACLALVGFGALTGGGFGVPAAFADPQGIYTEDAAESEAAAAEGEASPSQTTAPNGAIVPGTSVDTDEANIVDPTQRADNSFIYDTSIESLVEQPTLYNDRTVQVVGEVIGDKISAGRGMCWIVLASQDGGSSASISVLISEERAKQIDHFGRYGVTGTTLQVRGTYHSACKDHEGLADVHASDASVIAPGVETPDQFSFRSMLPGLVLVVVGVALLVVFSAVRERMR